VRRIKDSNTIIKTILVKTATVCYKNSICLYEMLHGRGGGVTRGGSCLKPCTTTQKVAGSFPEGVKEILL